MEKREIETVGGGRERERKSEKLFMYPITALLHLLNQPVTQEKNKQIQLSFIYLPGHSCSNSPKYLKLLYLIFAHITAKRIHHSIK